MVEVPEEFVQSVNKPGRIGVLATADAQGRPNAAYFGSPRFEEDGGFGMALADNRTLKNLEQNPYAVFLCLEDSPVSFKTKGCRLYLKVREIQKEGPLLDRRKEAITRAAGPEAAKLVQAAVVFDVAEVRALVAMP
ncbi:MAG: pyridoxamine 5'-phosphate oxidase family protein [Thermodesulfobacteriota bacterium]